MAETCPYCHQPLSADAGPCAKWCCGTWRRADGEVFQTSRCRVVQLEAENARLKAIVDDLPPSGQYDGKSLQIT